MNTVVCTNLRAAEMVGGQEVLCAVRDVIVVVQTGLDSLVSGVLAADVASVILGGERVAGQVGFARFLSRSIVVAAFPKSVECHIKHPVLLTY